MADSMPEAEILVADDNPVICQLLTDFLGGQGFHVRTVATGREVLRAIEERPPHIVVLDLYMPEGDGVEVLRRLRQRWPREFPFGVIILTGNRQEPLLEAALALGAFDVLLKPVSLVQLELAVRAQLALKPPPSAGGPPEETNQQKP